MSGKIPFIIRSDDHLWEYIGDLSQDVLECSYNEDDIRNMWRRGCVDEDVEQMLRTYPWRLGHWQRPQQQGDLLTALVIKFGGWSPNWGFIPIEHWTVEEWGEEGPPKNVVDPLTPEEQAIVAAFQAKYDLVIQ